MQVYYKFMVVNNTYVYMISTFLITLIHLFVYNKNNTVYIPLATNNTLNYYCRTLEIIFCSFQSTLILIYLHQNRKNQSLYIFIHLEKCDFSQRR